jgi:serine/tyrosine/threonine adenylyltransferase
VTPTLSSLANVLRFDNRFVRELPGDEERSPRPRQVHRALYSRVQPTPVRQPRLIAWSPEVGALLGIDETMAADPLFAEVFAGNALLDGMEPYSANYGGHQFGQWAGQLGDGRAITLGEVVVGPAQAGRHDHHQGRHENPDRGVPLPCPPEREARRWKADQIRWELQLKGAGLTPYSRFADGRAVLRSSIREFLCSEAMHHLGVPTTRALSLVATGESVMRDMFYDGRPRPEPGAIVCRVAPSFIRFGNFELPASRRDPPLLDQLVTFTIDRDFPELVSRDHSARDASVRAEWFGQVCERTARMVAEWMRVGFVHGVMNTDNMSVLGLTIDYGPYGWIDNFDLDWTPNTTDAGMRRYRFGQQPQIAYWNLARFAEALMPLFESADLLQQGLERFARIYDTATRAYVAAKLGLRECEGDDLDLMQALYAWMQAAEVDMTIFFRRLAVWSGAADAADVTRSAPQQVFADAFYDIDKTSRHEGDLRAWLERYNARIARDGSPDAERQSRMNAANPLYVLRNYLAQEAIDRAEQGDERGILELLEIMRQPYTEQPGADRFAARRPDWARNRAGCSMLSCSS